jgi:PAS domain-containing protein
LEEGLDDNIFGRIMGLASRTIHSSGRFFILPVLLLLCTLFYYFGELVDWAAWDALRQDFFYSIHDIHRLFFLAPIIYAGYVARVKGAVIITLVCFMIFLPRAFFISPFPDPVLRMVLFTLFAGAIGYLIATIRNECERRRTLATLLGSERDQFLRILNVMGDGVVIIGPDYKVRFVNSSMRRDFGEGVGAYCYTYLHTLNSPCEQGCKLPNVILDGKTTRYEYRLPGGTVYEVNASPYIDSDGAVCQLATFRNITHRKGSEPESSSPTS